MKFHFIFSFLKLIFFFKKKKNNNFFLILIALKRNSLYDNEYKSTKNCGIKTKSNSINTLNILN